MMNINTWKTWFSLYTILVCRLYKCRRHHECVDNIVKVTGQDQHFCFLFSLSRKGIENRNSFFILKKIRPSSSRTWTSFSVPIPRNRKSALLMYKIITILSHAKGTSFLIRLLYYTTRMRVNLGSLLLRWKWFFPLHLTRTRIPLLRTFSSKAEALSLADKK